MTSTALDKSIIRENIINAVIAQHGITRAELVGRSRVKKLAAARRDVIVRLMTAGFGNASIARILNRPHNTIHQIANSPDRRSEKRVYKILHDLPADVRAVLGSIAEAEGVSPQTVMKEWIYERARFELEAKARAA